MPKTSVTKTSRAQKAKATKTGVQKTKTSKNKTQKSRVTKPAAKSSAVKSSTKPAAKPVAKSRRTKTSERDVEKAYTHKQFVAKLRRLADSIEKGKNFQIMVAGEKIYVPDAAIFNIEHEREKGVEELEFQIKWKKAA